VRQVLRDYQIRARDELRAAIARLRQAGKPQRALLVSPTGSGKTTIAGAIIEGATARGGDVLFLAHRRELILQCSQRLDGIGVDHGILMGNHDRAAPWSRVQIASVQTLARRLDRLPKATLVIVDEAHHARASTYSHILDRYPDAAVLGLTATPWRLDNRGLGELFEELVVAAYPRDLIAQGHLVPYTGFAYDIPVLKGVKVKHGEFEQGGLALVMSQSKLAGNVVEQWLAHCAGRRTVLFAVNIAHSMDLVARFRARGVSAEHVDGTSSIEEREGALRRLSTGQTAVVCNVNVLTEGWDCPELEVVILARPTLSVGFYMQMVGRGMRPAPGKSQLRIHDHAGCILRHGVPDLERDYSLTADMRKPKLASDQALRRCTHCFALYAAQLKTCPQCGEAHQGRARVVQEHDGRAIPIEQLADEHARRKAYLDEQLRVAEASGKKRGWAAYRYKEKFGEWPPQQFWSGGMRRLDGEKLSVLSDRLARYLKGGAA
jgi:DNA repair protein RadD